MPGFDGTGPRGMGPMTGGGRGFCSPWGLGSAYGLGRGMPYPRYGIPYGFPYGGTPYAGATPYSYGGVPPGANPYASPMSGAQELDFLKGQAQAIKSQLEDITNRIKELET
jgi:hypothetical protein